MENPTTEDTTVPKTDTPVSEVPGAGDPGNVDASKPDDASSAKSSDAPDTSADAVPLDAGGTIADGTENSDQQAESSTIQKGDTLSGALTGTVGLVAGNATPEQQLADSEKTPHEFYLASIVHVLERDFNIFTGELAQLLASAKQHL